MLRLRAAFCALLLLAACGDIRTERVEVAPVPTPAPPAGATLPAALSPALGPPLAWHLELTRQSHETWFYAIARQKAVRRATRPPAASNYTHVIRPAGQAQTGTGACGGWEGLLASLWPADQVRTACRILMCESGGNPSARNPSGAIGLFQLLGHGGTTDPTQNAQVAYRLWNSSGWSPWVCR